jgi:DivIVA domain-containing protein
MPDQSSAASEHALLQEITAPLETLPDDPLALVEAEFPTSMRGYDRHAVDDYVEQVSRLVAQLHATRSPEAAVRRALKRVGEQISGILQRAHETSESITAQSRSEAEDRLEQARREGAAIVEAAERRVRELDADTDRIWSERRQVVADAEDLAERLRAVVAEAAERFPPEDGRASAAGRSPEAADTPQTPAAPDASDLPEPPAPTEPTEPLPRRLTDEDSTRIIPPASDAAQHRRES